MTKAHNKIAQAKLDGRAERITLFVHVDRVAAGVSVGLATGGKGNDCLEWKVI